MLSKCLTSLTGYMIVILKAMDLIRSMRDGSFDKKVLDSTAQVSPEKWRDHFQGLLGLPMQQSPSDDTMSAYIRDNCMAARTCLDEPFSRKELLAAISS